MQCEFCGYSRKNFEARNEPIWQCPNCHKAYNKTQTTMETCLSKEELKVKNTTYLKEAKEELHDLDKVNGTRALIKILMLGLLVLLPIEGQNAAKFLWGLVCIVLSLWLASDVKDMHCEGKVYAIEKAWSELPGNYTRESNPFFFYLYLLSYIGFSTGSFIFGAYQIIISIS